jgi:hypothetical protein
MACGVCLQSLHLRGAEQLDELLSGLTKSVNHRCDAANPAPALLCMLSAIVKNIKNEWETASLRDKPLWLSLVSSALTHSQLNALGFPASKQQRRTANENYTHKRGRFPSFAHPVHSTSGANAFPRDDAALATRAVAEDASAMSDAAQPRAQAPPGTLGERGAEGVAHTKAFTGETRNCEFLQFLRNNSREAANRTIKLQNDVIPVRYLNESKVALFKAFNVLCGGQMPKSTFYRNIPKFYKTPTKRTDVCEHCVIGNTAAKQLQRLETVPEPERSAAQRGEVERLRGVAEITNLHRALAARQRASFRSQCENLGENEAVLLFDFKENIKLGGGPIEVGQNFYSREQISMFTICVIYNENGRRHHTYIDFFSKILSHDSLFVIDCLKTFFQKTTSWGNIRGLHLWSDSGPHFRNSALSHFVLKQIFEDYGMCAEWNFFGEMHGKSIVDGHFGVVSRWLAEAERYVEIKTIEDLCRVINERTHAHPGRSEAVITIHTLEYTRDARPVAIPLLSISHICDFLCFRPECEYTPASTPDGETRRTTIQVHGFLTSDVPYGTANPLRVRVSIAPDTRSTKTAPPPRKIIDGETSANGKNFDARYKRRLAIINSEGAGRVSLLEMEGASQESAGSSNME